MTEQEKLFWPVLVVTALAVLILSFMAMQSIYDECRAAGHSVFYCVMVSG